MGKRVALQVLTRTPKANCISHIPNNLFGIWYFIIRNSFDGFRWAEFIKISLNAVLWQQNKYKCISSIWSTEKITNQYKRFFVGFPKILHINDVKQLLSFSVLYLYVLLCYIRICATQPRAQNLYVSVIYTG